MFLPTQIASSLARSRIAATEWELCLKNLPDGTVVYIQFDNTGRGTIEGKTLYVKPASTLGVNAEKTANTNIPTSEQNVNSGQTENSGNVGQVRKSPADMLMEAARPISANNAPVTNVVSGDE